MLERTSAIIFMGNVKTEPLFFIISKVSSIIWCKTYSLENSKSLTGTEFLSLIGATDTNNGIFALSRNEPISMELILDDNLKNSIFCA